MKENKAVQRKLYPDLSPDERSVVQSLDEAPETSIDVLAVRLKKPISWLSSTLLTLELQGVVMCLPGKKYRLT